MNLQNYFQYLLVTGLIAYHSAYMIRDSRLRPEILARLQLTEEMSVYFLKILSKRAAEEGETWLSKKLMAHAADEQRHAKILAQALKQLGKQVKRNFDNKPDPFFENYYEGYLSSELIPESIDWIVFFGSNYILELDGAKEFALMAKALPNESYQLKQMFFKISKDEQRHSKYLLEILQQRLSTTKAQKVIEEWRKRKTKTVMTLILNQIQKPEEIFSLTQNFV